MGLEIREYILHRVTHQYLTSGDFNGLPGRELLAEIGERECAATLEQLVRERLVSLNFGNYHPNPHIKAFPARSPDEQIATMRERGLGTRVSTPSAFTLNGS